MTTAPKLIREQLLALLNKHRTHVQNSPGVGVDLQRYAIAVIDDIDMELRTLAAEPVGETYLDDEGLLRFRDNGFLAPDSAEGVLYECPCGHIWRGDGSDQNCPKCNPDELRATDKGKDAPIDLAGLERHRARKAEQPKAEGGEAQQCATKDFFAVSNKLSRPQPERECCRASRDSYGYACHDEKPEQPARDGVQELAKRIPRLRLQRVEDGGYVGFELLADPEGPLCRFLDVRNSAFYADLIRGQPPQQADAEMQPAQCPQCLYAFAMPATTKQADGGAVLWVSQGSFDWIKEIGGSGYILAFGHPFDDGKHIPLYAARPPKSPGVGDAELERIVIRLYSRLFRVGEYLKAPVPFDPMGAIREELLAALGGEK